MSRIKSIKEPSEVKVTKDTFSSEERFLWWKKQYMLTFGIVISCLIVPIFMFRRGNIVLGIRMSIIFYLFIVTFHFFSKKRTEKSDTAFLKSKGMFVEKKRKWWMIVLMVLFGVLRIYVIYLLISTWIMTYG